MAIKKNHATNKMNFRSIVNEVMRTIFFFFFNEDILQKKAYKAPKQRLLRYFYTPKSIIKHTGDFHPDITSRSIKSKPLFAQIFFIRLKKMHKESWLMM